MDLGPAANATGDGARGRIGKCFLWRSLAGCVARKLFGEIDGPGKELYAAACGEDGSAFEIDSHAIQFHGRRH